MRAKWCLANLIAFYEETTLLMDERRADDTVVLLTHCSVTSSLAN